MDEAFRMDEGSFGSVEGSLKALQTCQTLKEPRRALKSLEEKQASLHHPIQNGSLGISSILSRSSFMIARQVWYSERPGCLVRAREIVSIDLTQFLEAQGSHCV